MNGGVALHLCMSLENCGLLSASADALVVAGAFGVIYSLLPRFLFRADLYHDFTPRPTYDLLTKRHVSTVEILQMSTLSES